MRRRALRKGLKPPGRAFVAGLTIGLFLCVTQLAANAQGQHCPVGQIFCFGKCVDISNDQANCGGCRILSASVGSSEMIGERLSDVTARPRSLPSRTS